MFEIQPEPSPEPPSTGPSAAIALDVVAAPKKRGRPRKTPLPEVAPELVTVQGPEVGSSADIVSPELTSPDPGSPDPTTVALADAAAPEPITEPKRRGRKPKAIPSAEVAPSEPPLTLEVSPEEVVESETPEPQVASQPEVPVETAPEETATPKPRTRGRKKAEPSSVTTEPPAAAEAAPKARARGRRVVEAVPETPETADPVVAATEPETVSELETASPEAVSPEAPRQRLVRVRKTARENVFETQAKLTNPLEMLLEYLRANPGGHAVRELEKDLEDALLKRLGGRKGLEEALETLLGLGALSQLKRHTYSLAREVGAVVGRLRLRPDGWGVVQPETPGLREMLIAPDALLFAWDGDRVVARETKRNGEAYGRVIRVLERCRGLIVGTLEFSRGAPVLRPDESGLPSLPLMAAEAPVGSRVVVAPRYPESTGEDDTFGIVTRLLGTEASLETEREAVRVKFGLPGAFSPEAEKEAQKVAGVVTKDLQGRVDLRGKRVIAASVTPGAPLEVGVQAEPLGNGNVLIGIHLADAQHFVDSGKAIDREAALRGAAVNLAGVLEPLLPEALTQSAALVVGTDRLAISVLVEASPDGNVVNYIVRQSVVNAKARLEDGLVGAEAELLERLGSGLRAVRGGAHSTMLEELLLLANRLVAALLASQEVPALYRQVLHQTADLEAALERSGGASPAMLAALRRAHTPPMQFVATAFPELEHQLELTRPLSRYADLLNQRVLVYAITKLSMRRRELLEETLPQLALSLAGLEQNAARAEQSLEQYRLLSEIEVSSQVKGIVTGVDPWGLDFTLENGARARLSASDMDDEYLYSDAPPMLKARGNGRVFKPGSIARALVTSVTAPQRNVRLSLGKENPMSKQKRSKSAQPGADAPRRQVVVLHAKPRGEYQRGVRVTARKLYFGEWSRAHFIATDEFGGEINLDRPQADRGPARGGLNRSNRGNAPQGQNSRPQGSSDRAQRNERSQNARSQNGASSGPNGAGNAPRPAAAQNNAASRASRIAELKRRADATLERNAARANRGPAEGSPGAAAPRSSAPRQVAAPAQPRAEGAPTEAAARPNRRRRRGGRGPKTTAAPETK